MAGSTNLVDAMLVLSVGFLIFLVVSWNMQSVVFANSTQEEKQQTMEAMKKAAEVQMGKELNQTPDTSSGSGEGYVEMGTVYKDPATGKLIMVGGWRFGKEGGYVENQNNISSNVDKKLKKLKMDGIKNVSLLSLSSDKESETLFYVDDSILTIKTVVNIDGKLEIFIEKSGGN